jgi:hypothetical protein
MKKNKTDSGITPKPNDIDKSSDEYKQLAAKFDAQFGDKIDVEFLESMSRRLDNKFQVLVDFTRESERSNCDILLFKNVISFITFSRNYKGIWWIFKMNFERLGTLFKFLKEKDSD